MNQHQRRRPSPALVISIIALFVALGGTAWGVAANSIGSSQIKNNSVKSSDVRNSSLTGTDIKNSSLTGSDVKNESLTGADVKQDSLTGSDIKESGLGQVPSASNADKLGSFGPSSWVRRDCSVSSGQIKGFAAVDSSPAFSSTFVPVSGYNCSDQSIQAKRLSMGRYQVQFTGSPVTRAVATAVVSGFFADAIGITNDGPGQFTVYVLNPVPSPGAFVDDPFTLIAP